MARSDVRLTIDPRADLSDEQVTRMKADWDRLNVGHGQDITADTFEERDLYGRDGDPPRRESESRCRTLAAALLCVLGPVASFCLAYWLLGWLSG